MTIWPRKLDEPSPDGSRQAAPNACDKSRSFRRWVRRQFWIGFSQATMKGWKPSRIKERRCRSSEIVRDIRVTAGTPPAKGCRQRRRTALFVVDLPNTALNRSFRKSQRKGAPRILHAQVSPPSFFANPLRLLWHVSAYVELQCMSLFSPFCSPRLSLFSPCPCSPPVLVLPLAVESLDRELYQDPANYQ